MLGLLAPAAIALLVGLIAGGSLRGLIGARFRAWPAIGLAFAVELALYNPPLDRQAWAIAAGPWIWMIARLVIVGVLVLNGSSSSRSAWAWRIAAAGVALNTVVIALNGGHMPQSPEAALAAWGASPIDSARLQNISVMGPETRLAWLGDVFAEPAWLPRRNVVSVGDILLASGVAFWMYGTIVSGRQTRRALYAVRRDPTYRDLLRTR
ncbi:MAG: DUF5317 domain-containing protein [Chloroflexi bacterium]|nr:DUF5317 domain-containing protein [Chloroflexota bacterium]